MVRARACLMYWCLLVVYFAAVLLYDVCFCDFASRYTDQTMLSGALHSWRHFPDDVELVERNAAKDRCVCKCVRVRARVGACVMLHSDK